MKVLTKEEVTELLREEEDVEKIEKESSLSWDGTSLLIRFPKEIADFLGVDKQNRLTKSIKFTVIHNQDKIEKRFEIIERTKPIRKNANEKKKKN